MAFQTVTSLDADVTVALGKTDRRTGKKGPKSAEGYYLGNRTVESKKGESRLHFLQTAEGNLGVWGTTDMNRKLSSVTPGTMVRITSTGTKPTPNGDMYTYKVEVDMDNTIAVETASDADYSSNDNDSDDSDASSDEDDGSDNVADSAALAAQRAEQKKKVEEIMKRGKTK